MQRGFAWWFGGIDLNAPLDEDGAGTSSGPSGSGLHADGVGTSSGQAGGDVPGCDADGVGTSSGPTHGDEPERDGDGIGTSNVPTHTVPRRTRSDAVTGVTLSSEESGSDGEVQSTPEGFVPKTPYLGMVFDSDDAALVHYNRYAKHVGFSMKIESSRKSAKDGEKDKAVFVCNKTGSNTEEPTTVKQRNRPITVKTECKAKLRIKRIGEKWHVTPFVEEHTHELMNKFELKKYLRSHKKMPKEEKTFIDLLHEVNLSSGRIMQIMGELYGGKKNVPYDAKTVNNYTASLAQEKFHDIPELLDYFEKIKEQDPKFFYKFKLDEMSRVERIFWVDGPAREAYKLYNDCISFDTTYLTNKYKMPCAPFIGINSFGQSIQFGCGFVRNEKIADFVWLFEMFLLAHDGLHPQNIITDQDGAMRSAILTLLLHTCHRNCRWHIMQKVQEKFGPFIAKREALRRDFNEVIDYSLTPEEFEAKWAEMLLKHDVVDNPNLADVYDLRSHFVPAYFMDRFFPFLQTTARSEGFNAVLKRYSTPKSILLRFFKQYMKLQEQIDVAEDGHEFMEVDKTVRTWCDFPMEKQILKTYTLPIYNRFQLELRKITSYNARDIGGGVYEVFPIQDYVPGYGSRTYRVAVDIPSEIYHCQCCKFSRDGILCCHVMKIMSCLGTVKRIPEHYILPRWSIPPPDIVVPAAQPVQGPIPGKTMSRKDMRMLRYGNLCTDFAKIAVDLAASEKTKEIAEKHMKAMMKEVADLKKANADALKRKNKGKATAGPDISEAMEKEAMEQTEKEVRLDENRKAQDPEETTTKGRPGQKRKQSGLHLQKKTTRATKCSVCNEQGHAPQDCPVRLANPELYPLLSLFQ